jgi:thiosulfate/3-mercaptopyruvate sulfurtransferase
MVRIKPIIDIQELLKLNDVLLFDAGGSPESKGRYESEHLQGAVYVDLDTQLSHIQSDDSNGGRHPLPDTGAFARTLTELGISKNRHIVIYDDKNGSNAAGRFWWMLRSAGHEWVQVLNGGLAEAKKHNVPLQSGWVAPHAAPEPYHIEQWNLPLALIDEVETASQDPNSIIVDVRSKERYDGITEPIDLIAGHIPAAINIPFTENMDDRGLFLPPDEIKKLYRSRFGESEAQKVIVHCGSGVTACHTLLALAHAEMNIPKLYVGSWSEWSRNQKKMIRPGNS